MTIKILMPALSPTMTEGTVAKWHKKEGDRVEPGDIIAEVESDKALMDVESIDEGVLGRILVDEGTEGVQVNKVIGVLLEEGEDASALEGGALEEGALEGAAPESAQPAPAEPVSAPAPAAPAQPLSATPARPGTGATNGGGGAATPTKRASPLARRMAEQSGLDLGAVAGSGPHGRIVRTDIEAALGGVGLPGTPIAAGAIGAITEGAIGAITEGAAGAIATLPPQERAAPAAAIRQDGERVFASPLARSMAAQANIDLAAVAGSGPEGRIVKRDIEQVLTSGGAATPRASGGAATPRAPDVSGASAAPGLAAPPKARPSPIPHPVPPGEESALVKMTTMRKVIAERMVESKTTVPHFYLTVDCEIDELLKARADINELRAADGIKLSVNDFVIRACALALREVPAANVTFEGAGMTRQYNTVDISVAVALDGGLITPVIRNADAKDLAAISAEMKQLAARARDGKLMPEEYQGGSFSISNLGMYGVKEFDAVINPPQAGILAVGAGEKRPVVRGDQIVPATVMSCTLSCDHRVVDGAIGAQLLAAVKRFIERPVALVI